MDKPEKRSGLARKSILTKSRKELKMMKRCVCMAALATMAMVVMVLLMAGSPNVTANTQQAAATEVKIDNFSFGPITITVPVGATVTWINRDDIPHTVVSTDDPKAFKSKVLDTDEKFSFTFSKPGTYPYFCSIHPKMTGKVIVQ